MSPKKRKAQGPQQAAPPPTSQPQYTSPPFSQTGSSATTTPSTRRRGHSRQRSDHSSARGPEYGAPSGRGRQMEASASTQHETATQSQRQSLSSSTATGTGFEGSTGEGRPSLTEAEVREQPSSDRRFSSESEARRGEGKLG